MLVSAFVLVGGLQRGRGARVASGDVEKHQIAGLDVAFWKPSRTVSGGAPLIVFSHGYHGCHTQTIFLMEALAKAGYFVVAPNHKDALCGGGSGLFARAEEPFRNPSAWSEKTYKDRSDDIVRLIDALRTDRQWSAAIDWSRVGLAGHSLGGYTVLGLAGGWPTWKLPSIRAVLALSPYCDPFTLHGSLGGIQIPVMYQGGTRDIGVTPTVKKLGEGCYAKTPSPAYFVEFDKAGHFAWTNLVTQYTSPITHYSVAFFDKFLRNDSKADLTTRVEGVSDLRSK